MTKTATKAPKFNALDPASMRAALTPEQLKKRMNALKASVTRAARHATDGGGKVALAEKKLAAVLEAMKPADAKPVVKRANRAIRSDAQAKLVATLDGRCCATTLVEAARKMGVNVVTVLRTGDQLAKKGVAVVSRAGKPSAWTVIAGPAFVAPDAPVAAAL